jgi:hypothetical protein
VILIVARFAVMSSWLFSRLGEVRSSFIPDCVLAAAFNSSIQSFFTISLGLSLCSVCSLADECELRSC